MKRCLIGLVVVGLLFASVANAEVRKGDVLLDFLAGWTLQNPAGDGDDINVFFGALRPEMALTDNIRVGGAGAVLYMDAGDGGDVTLWTLGVSGEYVFMPANQLNPYIGGMFAWASADLDVGDTLDGWLLAPRAGILYTLNTTNNLFAEYQFQFWGGDIDEALDNGHMILLGIEHKFKVGQ
jgi:hypothetical protein